MTTLVIIAAVVLALLGAWIGTGKLDDFETWLNEHPEEDRF